MKQPTDEKGNPTNNPTGTGGAVITSSFTDGNNSANIFVKELYIDFDWDAYKGKYDGLYLDFATWNTTYNALSIFIAPRNKGKKSPPYDDIANSLAATNCTIGGITKLKGEGFFANVEAYIVADWVTVWNLPTSQTGLTNGTITFNAKIQTEKSSNLDNSPRIKQEIQRKKDEFAIIINKDYSELPKSDSADFIPSKPKAPSYDELIDATWWKNFKEGIDNNNDVSIVLQTDIYMGKKDYNSGTYKRRSLFNIPKGKTLRIIGNGFGIYEYGYDNEIVLNDNGKGRKEADFSSEEVYKEVFATGPGNPRQLAKSNVYEAEEWAKANYDGSAAHNEACGVKVPDALREKFDSVDYDDNVYIWLLVSWTRTLHKISKYENGIIYFERLSKNGYNKTDENGNELYDKYLHTDNGVNIWNIIPKPTFFLVNTAMDNDGILIKDGKVSCPSSFPSRLWQCKAEHLINVEEGATLFVENTVFCGGKASCIMNSGTLCMEECDISNPVGGGVYTNGKAFFEHCLFHDIQKESISQVANDREKWTPDSPGADWPCMSVTNNVFRNIDHYGLNNFAIRNECVAYIAHNRIEDANYGGIWTGNNSSFIREYRTKDGKLVYNHKGKDFLPAFKGLVEFNYIHFTDEWVEKRKLLGFQDSGGIYVAPNNGRAIIRFNRLERCGGRHMNKAIYGDDGPYNTEIYCNMVSGTENDFDIDFRDLSGRKEHQHDKISGTYVNTNDTICLNYCKGFVRIKNNLCDNLPEDEKDALACAFKDNAALEIKVESSDKTAPNKNDIEYRDGDAKNVATPDRLYGKVLYDFIQAKIKESN